MLLRKFLSPINWFEPYIKISYKLWQHVQRKISTVCGTFSRQIHLLRWPCGLSALSILSFTLSFFSMTFKGLVYHGSFFLVKITLDLQLQKCILLLSETECQLDTCLITVPNQHCFFDTKKKKPLLLLALQNYVVQDIKMELDLHLC